MDICEDILHAWALLLEKLNEAKTITVTVDSAMVNAALFLELFNEYDLVCETRAVQSPVVTVFPPVEVQTVCTTNFPCSAVYSLMYAFLFVHTTKAGII